MFPGSSRLDIHPGYRISALWLEKQRSLHTRSCYRRNSERLLNHANKPLLRITLADLQKFAQSLIESGLAPISRVRALAAIKRLFGFCHRMHYIPANPAAELALPRYERRLTERILSKQDLYRILAADAKARDHILLNLLYVAGLRVSEACGLRWRSLITRGDTRQVTVFGKGGKMRAIALPAPLWSELISVRGPASAEEWVFPSRTGSRLDRASSWYRLRSATLRWRPEAPICTHARAILAPGS
jgi:integrase/recombinase XerD